MEAEGSRSSADGEKVVGEWDEGAGTEENAVGRLETCQKQDGGTPRRRKHKMQGKDKEWSKKKWIWSEETKP